MENEAPDEARPEGRLGELARLFLKMGCVAFGGPAAHVALLEDEVVDRRRWLDRRYFLDLMGATHLVPGPNSTEMVLHVGYERAGFLGLVTAGTCFLFPAVLMTAALAWFYSSYGSLPAVEPWVRGMQPAVLAVLAVAVWKLGRKALGNAQKGIIALCVAAAVLFGVGETPALLAGGVLGGIFLGLVKRDGRGTAASFVPLLFLQTPTAGATAATAVSLPKLFLFFLKVGSVLYGSGYVLVAFLEGDLVERYGWLTQQELLDAIAVGQFTPGPVLSTATFVGYLVEGLPGAALATLGIFLPSFLIVLALNPLVPRLRDSNWAGRFLDAVNASAVALMAVVASRLADGTLTSLPGILVFVGGLVALVKFKVSSMWVVLGGVVLSGLASFLA